MKIDIKINTLTMDNKNEISDIEGLMPGSKIIRTGSAEYNRTEFDSKSGKVINKYIVDRIMDDCLMIFCGVYNEQIHLEYAKEHNRHKIGESVTLNYYWFKD